MTPKLRYLLVEDMESDAKLLAHILKRGGYDPEYERVDTAEVFLQALEKKLWDLVIADYNLPLFSGMEALRLLRESGLDLPFILVSGAIGEEIAVESLLAGARDFIVKGKWERLIPSIQRELKEAKLREENRRREETLNKAEREIAHLKQRVEFILGATKTGLDIIDSDFNIQYIDPAWEKIYGDFRGKKCYGYFMDATAPCHDCGIHEALRTKKTIVKEQILAKEGHRPIQVTTIPFQDSAGNWLVAEANVDITERKKVEKSLEESLREKEFLLREIHHRVKNNLQVVSGLLSLQSNGVEDKKQADIFQKCRNRIEVMAFIHEKLCQSEDFTRIDFTDIAKSLAYYLSGMCLKGPKKIDFVFEMERIFLGVDTAIPCGLILNELLSNAITHAFPGETGGEVAITLRKTGKNGREGPEEEAQEFELTVRDNGVGLPQEVDPESARSMGLYLVSNLVKKQLHGEMKLDRSKGTEYKIRFRERKYNNRMGTT